MQYLVMVPNAAYDRKVFGIQFNKGRAVIADEVLDPSIKLSAAEIAKRMKEEFGYTVKPIGTAQAAAVGLAIPPPATKGTIVPAAPARPAGKPAAKRKREVQVRP